VVPKLHRGTGLVELGSGGCEGREIRKRCEVLARPLRMEFGAADARRILILPPLALGRDELAEVLLRAGKVGIESFKHLSLLVLLVLLVKNLAVCLVAFLEGRWLSRFRLL